MEKHILAPKTSIEEMYMEKTNLKGAKKKTHEKGQTKYANY